MDSRKKTRYFDEHYIRAQVLARFEMLLANQKFLITFVVRIDNWRRKVSLIIKTKEEQEKKTLAELQKPTSQAIKEQVSEEF